MDSIFSYIIVIIVLMTIVSLASRITITEKDKSINSWSYTRFAKFFGKMELADKHFNEKVNKIYKLIVQKKYEDINKIANESGCSYEECIIKMKYLKNKRVIGDYYIDIANSVIRKCSPED